MDDTVTAGIPRVDWTAPATRFVLFTGKGGVGKTTVAAATAVGLADKGHRVLLVSTDPASNLGDVFGTNIGEAPTPVAAVPHLHVMDLDPQRAADEYRARVVGPYRGVLADPEVAALEERLAGACTVEVAAFDAFARLLARPAAADGFDHVVFDTAPTGHTLRLLSLPAAWSDYLAADPDATSCLGPLAGLQDDRPRYAAAVEALRDPTSTTVVLVTRPDRSALHVAATAAHDLAALGIAHQRLVVNGVLPSTDGDDPIAAALTAEQHASLLSMPAVLRALPTTAVTLMPIELVGVEALRRLITGSVPVPSGGGDASFPDVEIAEFGHLVDEVERGGHGLVLVTGKGGVGKTTVARLVAETLAGRGHDVHLATTDPAGRPATSTTPSLTTSSIDPEAATREYVEGKLRAATARGLDREHLDLLAEDLRSPCSQEVAVFQAFSQLLGRARRQFVVVDTAPTGHTLLLLDVTGSYHRQVMQDIGASFRSIVTPLMRLQDPALCKVLIVTLAETTPVAESAELQDDLRRAGIEPYGWVVNATLARSGTHDPTLVARAALEQDQIARIATMASRAWLLPWGATR